MSEQKKPECFVIMPISDPDGYPEGHFQKVYDYIHRPAIETAGFKPKRADEVEKTNLIQLDILQNLINAPMALCDLSSRNPNVLFELGIRQAFDKPVSLIQEVGTPRIFDISGIRSLDYKKSLDYGNVLASQRAIAEVIKQTWKSRGDTENINSIVSLLSVEKATVKPLGKKAKEDLNMSVIRAEIQELTSLMRDASNGIIPTPAIPNNDSKTISTHTYEFSVPIVSDEYQYELFLNTFYTSGWLDLFPTRQVISIYEIITHEIARIKFTTSNPIPDSLLISLIGEMRDYSIPGADMKKFKANKQAF